MQQPSQQLSPQPSVSAPPIVLSLTSEQQALFKRTLELRKIRDVAEVLIVEDQPFSSSLLSSMLQRNYKVHVANNAQVAWELYANNAPDIVMLDIELPDMDGHNFAQHIRAIDPKPYIIMVTGNHSKHDVLKARDNNVRGYVVKPYSKQKILDALQNFQR